jgi:hypothetical protein
MAHKQVRSFGIEIFPDLLWINCQNSRQAQSQVFGWFQTAVFDSLNSFDADSSLLRQLLLF